MKKYNAYKNSGVEWIGEIPEEWDVLLVIDISRLTKFLKLRKSIVNGITKL